MATDAESNQHITQYVYENGDDGTLRCKGCGSLAIVESGSESVCTACGLVAADSAAGFDLQPEYGQGVAVDERGRFFSEFAASARPRADRMEAAELGRARALRICEETCERLGAGCLRERAAAMLERFAAACRVSRAVEALRRAALRDRMFAAHAALHRAEASIRTDDEGDTEEDGEGEESVEEDEHKDRERQGGGGRRAPLRAQARRLRERIAAQLRHTAPRRTRGGRSRAAGDNTDGADAEGVGEDPSGEEEEEEDEDDDAEQQQYAAAPEPADTPWPLPAVGDDADGAGTRRAGGPHLLLPIKE